MPVPKRRKKDIDQGLSTISVYSPAMRQGILLDHAIVLQTIIT